MNKKRRKYKNRRWKIEPRILPFNRISVTIPRKFLLKELRSPLFLTYGNMIKTKQKLVQIEIALNKVLHAKSVVEKVLNKKGTD